MFKSVLRLTQIIPDRVGISGRVVDPMDWNSWPEIMNERKKTAQESVSCAGF
jgi:hypothetical protein